MNKREAWNALPEAMRADLPEVVDLLRAADMLGDPALVELWQGGRQLYGPVDDGVTLTLGDWGLRK